MKTSIFYYTNNIIPRELLRHTLHEAVKHARINNCELVLTQHFPITQTYETVDLGVPLEQKDKAIHKYTITDCLLSDKEADGVDIKSYVLGRLPCSYESILYHLLLSEAKCSGDNIVLMEHDCLYPEQYVPAMSKALSEDAEVAFFGNSCFLNKEGFAQCSKTWFMLSQFAIQRAVFKTQLESKLKLFLQGEKWLLEPVLRGANENEYYAKEIVIDKHRDVSEHFPPDECILDIKHGLNADGYQRALSYMQTHAYWGEAGKYHALIDSLKVEECDKKASQKLWPYGLGKL